MNRPRTIMWYILENPSDEIEQEDEVDDESQFSMNPVENVKLIKFQTPVSNQFPIFNKLVPFSFWTGLTDFELTIEIAQQISQVEGVEIFDHVSRYRFNVAIAPSFNEEEVMNNIEMVVGANLENTDDHSPMTTSPPSEDYTDADRVEVEKFIKFLNQSFPWWTLYIDEDAAYVFSSSKPGAPFVKDINKFLNEAVQINGGQIIENS